MGIKTAVSDNGMRVIPFLVLLTIAWLGLTTLDVWNSMQSFTGFTDQYVGHAAISGYIGLAVLLVTALAAVYLYGEAGAAEPGPKEFPPR
ncbi:hypothetical protein [Halomarina litorea]|uniref:hypothetical protein n=1 Tax=Halomarina litorea TaxID=2961595 RepID=UPI0020C584AC|nr:hypothetical protein [Halomarina sp. BCD28]